MRIRLSLTALCLLLPMLAACPDGQPGDPCSASGSGFTREDSCSTMCLDWPLQCPGGGSVTPNVCAGESCAGPGASCPAGMDCLLVDSFNHRCVHAFVCSSGSGLEPQPEAQPAAAEPAVPDPPAAEPLADPPAPAVAAPGTIAP